MANITPEQESQALVEAMAPLHAPAAAAIAMHVRTRREMVEKLRKRADWLRKEYLNGGDFPHLSAREQECLYIASLIEDERL